MSGVTLIFFTTFFHAVFRAFLGSCGTASSRLLIGLFNDPAGIPVWL
jgi:hypothetical protein